MAYCCRYNGRGDKMTEVTTLMVPKTLAEAIRKIVEKRDVPST